MAVAFRSQNTVTNSTAGTSVTVNKPAGIVDTGVNSGRDMLIAIIGTNGAPTVTAPAGWTLIQLNGAAGPEIAAYWKLASSEGASWTWTLGTSQRNWGWVGAYTGVDPDSPVDSTVSSDIDLTSSTTLDVSSYARPGGMAVAAAVASRTATGSATTWTTTGIALTGSVTTTERFDTSTNAGAGTDIAGVVGDSLWTASFFTNIAAHEFVASQAQGSGAAIAIGLHPYFTPYAGGVGEAGIVLEAALGVDPDGDSSTWTWTDLTAYVLNGSQLVLSHGRANRSSLADPCTMTFTLLNLNGEFTNPGGAYSQYMKRSLPFRVRLDGSWGTGGDLGYHRGTAFLASMKPGWDTSGNVAIVDIIAAGRLRRIQQRTDPVHSAAYTELKGLPGSGGRTPPVAYWPFEDESDATVAASAVSGVNPAVVSGVTFAGDSTILGSSPLVTLSTTTSIVATVPTYSSSGFWAVAFMAAIPGEPAAETTLLEIATTGTAARWKVSVAPGTSAVHIRAFDGTGTQVLDNSVTITEASFYGFGVLYFLTCTQNGTGVDYELTTYTGDGTGVGFSGTLASNTSGNVRAFYVTGQAGLASAGFGHLALYATAGVNAAGSSDLIVSGNTVGGDWPWERFQRICESEGIPYIETADANTDITMGTQPIDTVMNIFRECETIESNVLNDSGQFYGETGLVWFPAHTDRENVDPTMVLDIAAGDIRPGFEPALDDQDIVNDVTASRASGSHATVTDDSSIATEGRYREEVTVNAFDDRYLAQFAGWRVNLGTVEGMRFPTVGWNLRGRPSLAQDWLDCRLFGRIDITNPPVQYPPDDIQAVLEGYTETLALDEWTVTANLSPYAPNRVFRVASDAADTSEYLGRLAGDEACAIRGSLNSSATSIPFDPNRYRWTTTTDDFPMTVRFGGETATVTSNATTAATFVAAGAASHADNAAVTPALFAGATASDLILVFAAIRSSGTGTLVTPTGYTRLPVWASTDNVQLYAKVHSGSESNPTVTPSGGAAGDTVSAVTFGFRNMPITLTDLADIVVDSNTFLNGAAQDIIHPPVYPIYQQGCVMLILGWKQDDWTSVATLGGLTEITDSPTTTGNDQGLVADYLIQTTPSLIGQGTFTVTGGAAAISRAGTVALAGGFQTLTLSARSVNGVTKSHSASTLLEVEDPKVLAL